MKTKRTNKQIMAALELPYSSALMLKYHFIKERAESRRVMTVMQRVADHPSVAKKREKLGSIETILRHMSPRQVSTLRRVVTR